MTKKSKPNVIEKTNEYAAEFSSGIEGITDRVDSADRLDSTASTDNKNKLGSGTSKVFINASSVEKEMTAEMRKFLDFLCGRDPESELTKGIASAVEKVKADKKIRRQYMFLSEMMGEEYEKGIEQGNEQRGYDAVDRLVADGKYNIREACSILGVDYDAYTAYRAEKEKLAVNGSVS